MDPIDPCSLVNSVDLRSSFWDDQFSYGCQPNHLFIMSPHPDDLDGLHFLQNLVHEAVLNGDATGISSRKVSDQLFKGGRGLKRIFGQDFK